MWPHCNRNRLQIPPFLACIPLCSVMLMFLPQESVIILAGFMTCFKNYKMVALALLWKQTSMLGPLDMLKLVLLPSWKKVAIWGRLGKPYEETTWKRTKASKSQRSAACVIEAIWDKLLPSQPLNWAKTHEWGDSKPCRAEMSPAQVASP